MKESNHLRALPRGPHSLSRDEVERSQRQRLYIAMIESVAARGYANTSVADVISRAGVSRATFYRLFEDKEGCFRAAYEMAAEQVSNSLLSGFQTLISNGLPFPASFEGQNAESNKGAANALRVVDHLVGTYLEMLADQPALAKAFLVEVYAAGPKAIEQRQRSLEAFIDLAVLVLGTVPGVGAAAQERRFSVAVMVHGVGSMVTAMVGTGKTDRLPELRAPLVALAAELVAAQYPL